MFPVHNTITFPSVPLLHTSSTNEAGCDLRGSDCDVLCALSAPTRPSVYQRNLTRDYWPISRVQRAGLGSNSDQWRMWVRVPIYVCLISMQFWWNISLIVEILDVQFVTSLWYLRFGRLSQRSDVPVYYFKIPRPILVPLTLHGHSSHM